MITRWIGKSFELRDGLLVTVVALEMCANGRINLSLRSPRGKLYLTTIELERNIART